MVLRRKKLESNQRVSGVIGRSQDDQSWGRAKKKPAVEVLDSEKDRDDTGNYGAPWPRPTRNVTQETGVWMPAKARLSRRPRVEAEIPPKIKGRSSTSPEADDTLFNDYKDDPARRIVKKKRDLDHDRDPDIFLQGPGYNEQLQDVAPALKTLGPETHAGDKTNRRRRRAMLRQPKRAGTNSVNWEQKDPFILRLMYEIVYAVDRWNEEFDEVFEKVTKKYKLTDREQALLKAYMNDYAYRVDHDPFGLFEDEKYKNIFARTTDKVKKLFGRDEAVQGEFRELLRQDDILNTAYSDLKSIGELELVATSRGQMSEQINTVLSKLREEPSRYTNTEDYSDVVQAIEKVVLFAESNDIPVAESLKSQSPLVPLQAVAKKVAQQKSTNYDHINMIREINRMNRNIGRIGKISGSVKQDVVKRGYRELEERTNMIHQLTFGIDERDQKLAQVTGILGTVNTDLERVLRVLESFYKPAYYDDEIDTIDLPREFSSQQNTKFRQVFGCTSTMLDGYEGELRILTRRS